MERIYFKGKRWVEKQEKTKHPADNKKAERRPIKVSHKQLWQDLILSGTLRENIHKLQSWVLLSLMKVLPQGKQFTPVKEGSEKPGVLASALLLTEELQGWIAPHP